MVRIVVVSAALLPILVGCAAPSAHLVNDKGQKTQCSAFGLGLLGSFIALTMVAKLRRTGRKARLSPSTRKHGFRGIATDGVAGAPIATTVNSGWPPDFLDKT